MKKLLLSTVLAASLFATQAFAETIFYSGGQTGAWNVFGNAGNATQNAACVAETKWQDGSTMQLIKDLKSGELYIWFQNYEWNIADAPGDYSFRMNLVNRANQVVGGDMTYSLINKNTIAIRGIDVNSFIPAFMEMSEMRILMPGDIQPAYIPLDGSTAAVQKLLACLDESKKLPPIDTAPLEQKPNAEGQQPKVPGQDI
jgi:hypothetical protein